MKKWTHSLLLILLAAVFLFSASCSSQPRLTGIRKYALSGEVMILVPGMQRAVVRHGDIDGWLSATNLEYPVRDAADFAKLQVGDQITATVFVQDSEYWLGTIAVVHRSSEK